MTQSSKPLYRLKHKGQQVVIYPWVPTTEDLKRLNEGKPVYMAVASENLLPVLTTTNLEDFV
jgi:hypothetical protein